MALSVFVGDGLHHALSEQALKRFIEVQESAISKDFGKKARVEQMQNGVLNAADVLIDRQPVIHSLRRKGRFWVVGVGVAQKVPGRIEKGVHGVGFAFGGRPDS